MPEKAAFFHFFQRFVAIPCEISGLEVVPLTERSTSRHFSFSGRQTSRALPYGFPIAAEGNTNATGKYDSTATPLYVAGVKVHPLTALVAAPDNTPKPFNTRSLTNLPSVPTVRITTTVPDVTVFAGNAAKVAEFTCAGRKSPFDRSN